MNPSSIGKQRLGTTGGSRLHGAPTGDANTDSDHRASPEERQQGLVPGTAGEQQLGLHHLLVPYVDGRRLCI
jgi:hypothetical protein